MPRFFEASASSLTKCPTLKSFERFAINSNKATDGDMFIPIIGERTDGHKYINSALENGAVATFTSAKIEEYIEGKNVVIDYSAPNIAKPFHIGHLRNTVIGAALYNVYKYLGYNTIGMNHLGDYGTQFGKMIEGYKLWGNEYNIEENPIEIENGRFRKGYFSLCPITEHTVYRAGIVLK